MCLCVFRAKIYFIIKKLNSLIKLVQFQSIKEYQSM